MAGAVMTLTEITYGTVKKIKAEWTSDSVTGAVSATTVNEYDGRILGVCTVPSATAPTADYDIALNDNDGVDIALGALADRHTSNIEYVAEAAMAGVAHSPLTIAVTAAGASKLGTVYIYIR